jgi:DNA-directed RNA polymerase specialized sigma24 family protein
MDEAAFSDYVAARRPQLFRTACLLCGDAHRAEDVVQDALTRLYGAWDRVARMDNVDGYVRRVIVLRHIWNLTIEETTAGLRISAGTVKSQNADAVAALRRALAPSLVLDRTGRGVRWAHRWTRCTDLG